MKKKKKKKEEEEDQEPEMSRGGIIALLEVPRKTKRLFCSDSKTWLYTVESYMTCSTYNDTHVTTHDKSTSSYTAYQLARPLSARAKCYAHTSARDPTLLPKPFFYPADRHTCARSIPNTTTKSSCSQHPTHPPTLNERHLRSHNKHVP